MSVPRAKTPTSGADNNSKTASETKPSTTTTTAQPKKSLPAPIVKSKIPKQDKSSTLPESAKTDKNADQPATPTSTRRAVTANKSNQDNPASSTSRSSSAKHTPSTVGFVATSMGGQKRVLENQFATKKNRYVALRQDIVDKQKSSEKAFEELFQLREKIISSGGRDPGRLEELVPAPSIATALGRARTSASAGEQITGDGDADLISILETNLRQMSEDLLVFCREALEKRTSVLDWLIDYEAEPNSELPSPLHMKEEMAGQLDTYKVENVEFEERLDATRQAQFRQVDELVQRIRCLWHECQVYKKERQNPKPTDTGNSEDLMKELKIEREKFMKARAKIREQENALASSEAKLKQAQDSARQLEAQLKSKETALEQKSRELAKLQKSHDAAKAKLEKHSDTVEARVAKLKEELGAKESEARKMVAQYKKQVQELESDLENERKATREFDETMEKLRARNAKLEEKCKQLLDMQERSSRIPEQNTDYDIQLFNDLKKTKKLLAEKEEVIQKLQHEREEIMAAADHENDSSKERLTAELLKKTNELQATRNQFVQLQKNYQKMQQRAEGLEVRLSDMSRLQAQLKESSGGRSYGAQVVQLQQQLTDLRGSLNETNKQNAELEKTCAQLQLKVDRYKRYLNNLEGNMKVRSEARSLLQHKDATESDDAAAGGEQSHLNSINAEEYQQVCAMLETKEMQVMRLEKLVKQMEQQEEYSQTQRTRLESRIAELEFALKEGKLSQRYVSAGAPLLSYEARAAASYEAAASAYIHRPHRHRHVEKIYACREIHHHRVEPYDTSTKRASGSYPIYKWLIKPFARESSSSAAGVGPMPRSRHCARKLPRDRESTRYDYCSSHRQ